MNSRVRQNWFVATEHRSDTVRPTEIGGSKYLTFKVRIKTLPNAKTCTFANTATVWTLVLSTICIIYSRINPLPFPAPLLSSETTIEIPITINTNTVFLKKLLHKQLQPEVQHENLWFLHFHNVTLHQLPVLGQIRQNDQPLKQIPSFLQYWNAILNHPYPLLRKRWHYQCPRNLSLILLPTIKLCPRKIASKPTLHLVVNDPRVVNNF